MWTEYVNEVQSIMYIKIFFFHSIKFWKTKCYRDKKDILTTIKTLEYFIPVLCRQDERVPLKV